MLASYREHGLALAKGMSARSIMAELFGKATGCSKGKGGSMHMFDKSLGFLGGHAIVGGQIRTRNRNSFRHEVSGHRSSDALFLRRSRGEPGRFSRVAQHGPTLETALHLHLRKQPVRHGHFPRPRDVVCSDIAQKACAYEMASEFVDGMDVLAVREATLRAVERARKDYLPTLLEIRTYRFMGHSMSDPGNYRTRAEIEKYQERDPIKLFSASLLEEKIVDQKALDEIDRKVREEVEDSLRFAEESPLPGSRRTLHRRLRQPNRTRPQIKS